MNLTEFNKLAIGEAVTGFSSVGAEIKKGVVRGKSTSNSCDYVQISDGEQDLSFTSFLKERVERTAGFNHAPPPPIAETIKKAFEARVLAERNFNGITSTAIPRFELIPKAAMESLALRMELGIERKGDGAWNALTQHLEGAATSNEFVIERLSHCIGHCMDAIQKVQHGGEMEEDDAGAILFAGSVLAVWRAKQDASH